ncbi:uncharacterized protein EI97DRAFT_351106, partial [Westerdykella ornata]
TASVIVGAGGNLVFQPPSLAVPTGTLLRFSFLARNHSLTQSEFANPCLYNGGFDSGFNQFNPTNISGEFVVEYEVTSPSPQWFFCAQTLPRSHCNAGMVFSLNPRGAHYSFLQNA